jgi:16S rRNA (guanine1207-N2)-methyltransferase
MPEPTSGHYFDAEPAALSAPREVDLILPGVSLRLTTDRGVFAVDGVDPGTKLLLLEAPPPSPQQRTVLDLGCGYGAIAVALARLAPHCTIWAVDSNERARALCSENAARAEVGDRVRVCGPDEVDVEVEFDVIYSNPPIRIGKPALHALLERWLGRLTPDGFAYLVVQKHLGADSLARWLGDEGWTVTRLVSRRAYRILQVRR